MSTTNGSQTNRQATLLALALVVSFCSFAYEFVYSELLTVMYGGTVTQYTITIGLYFFALGLGASLVDDLDIDHAENFTRIEVYIALVATAGFIGIILLNSVATPAWLPYWMELLIARGPPILVGFLSGFEFPLLAKMVEKEDDGGDLLPDRVQQASQRLHDGFRVTLGVFFHTDADSDRTGLSMTLAMDYLGGLLGALVYAKVLYPMLGLIPTIFVLGLLNAVAALVFVVRFSDRRWGLFAGETRPTISREGTVTVVTLLVLTASLGGVVAHHDRVNSELSGMYLEHQFEEEYVPYGSKTHDPSMEIDVTGHRTTKYQTLISYERTWVGNGPNPYFNGSTESCLRMGEAVQLCNSWGDSYHNGLVDVPMSMYDNGSQTEVLLIGGGDHIALNYLRDYNVSVTRVDLDGQFMQYAKDAPLFAKYHDNAYTYPNQTTIVGDGYAYLQQTEKEFDIIMLDIPGATDGDLLKLYSKEFYQGLRTHLKPGGTVVSWAYSPANFPQHNKAYLNTVAAAGFESKMDYWALEDIDGDGQREQVEKFYIFSPSERNGTFPTERGNEYVQRHADRFSEVEWTGVPTYRGVEVNSIFDPNYDIIIK